MPPERGLRRNGQPQACEPCRKTKVRCDHGRPRCSRCVLRRLDCVYHPNPMSKPRGVVASPPASHRSPALPGSEETHRASSSPTKTPGEKESVHVTSSGPSPAGPASPALPRAGAGAAHRHDRRGSLFQKQGMPYGTTTRYSAVFLENHASFGPAILDDAEDDGGRGSLSGPSLASRGFDARNSRRELAIDTLMEFPSLRTCEMLMQNVGEMYDVWQSPTMIRQCLDQVWREHGAALGSHRSRASVARMARDLFANGNERRPSPEPGVPDDESWHNWFGGPRLRWEMIGILFTWAGMMFRHKQEWDPIFQLAEQHGMNRQTAAENMRVCADNCLRLCDDFVEINDIIIVLMKNCAKLRSNVVSDESDHIRMDFGTTGAAFITAGLHRLPVSPITTPRQQYRSIISSSFFHIDKCESLFSGRPPILDKRFCYIPPPLDLCEEDVYNGHARFQAALQTLDARGWNTDKKIYASTWLRAVSLLSPIREEILGLSLTATLQFTKAQVDALVTQLEQIVRTYPPHIRYDTIEHQDVSSAWKQAPHERYLITRIQLDVLQCAFLLQRLMVSGGYSNGQDLFNVAYDMIQVVLSFWASREHLRDYNFSFDWVILSYGIPSAGILCLELLRASNLAPPMAPTSTIAAPAPVQLSRSEVVQSLTMFIAFLDWIRPTDNNAQLCGKFKKVVKRIIDTAIDAPRPTYPPRAPGPPHAQTERPAHVAPDQLPPPPSPGGDGLVGTSFMHDLDPALMAMDDLDWLNTVDWTQGDWLELSQQNFTS